MVDTKKILSRWQNLKSKLRIDTFGNIAIAAFLISAVSGILLAIPYDVNNPYDSIAEILLVDPYSSFIRNIHYWSSQIFLIFTFLHIWDHFKQGTEKKVKRGVWFRLVLSVLFTLFVMLTGFILKGDAESMQAWRILSTLLNEIPLIGNILSISLLGNEGDFQLLYVHHIATATIFLAIIIFEHVKYIWTKNRTTVFTLIFILAISFCITPRLHDNLNPIVKGPWFYLGLQEILHWISNPVYTIVFIFLLLVIFYYIPKMNDRNSAKVKKLLVYSTLVYFVLTVFAYYFRGENWEFTWPWNNQYLLSRETTIVDFSNNIDDLEGREIPKALGRLEGCLTCHSDVKGFTASHSPEAIGCSSCHLGNPFTINKEDAHKGMILIPGNLKTARISCGSSNCHNEIVDRVGNSIMNTLSGMISVNKYVFNELPKPSGLLNVANIGDSPSESHLRKLCVSCHLSNSKIEFGEINEESRGGGCNACHLNYSKEALNELKFYNEKYLSSDETVYPKFHPSASLNITDDHCFGCHSRSGRISTNYTGWHETKLNSGDVIGGNEFKILKDGRVFRKVKEDVHHTGGLMCIDCHISYEVMGDGNLYEHKEDHLVVTCEDCHSKNLNVISSDGLDSEAKKIINIRKSERENHLYLVTSKGNYAIPNTFVDSIGTKYLIKKKDNSLAEMRRPKFICTESEAHSNLSCNSCHTFWVPQCIGCHTDYDPNSTGFDLFENIETKGQWVEHVGEYFAELPTLGVKENKGVNGIEERKIDTFMPGMILTLDKSNYPGAGDKEIFKRLFAPAFSHTIVKESRGCKSCHNDPLAIGYGRGELIYKIESKKGRWHFTPRFSKLKYDGLPEDAWIGFLQNRVDDVSTRINSRPFNFDEQKKILTVGACLECHPEDSKIMQESLINFNSLLKRLSNKCLLPDW